MKKLLIFCLLLFFTVTVQSQFYSNIRVGYAVKSNQPFIAPTFCFKAYGISAGADMVVNYREDYPADFGVRISYQYKFIEAGAAHYYELFSTDPETKYKNGWANAAFVIVSYDRFFLQYEYLHEHRVSFGMKVEFNR